jgi:hypothetical protein
MSVAIPTIDLVAWRAGADLGPAVDAALQNAGFLLVTGHGVDAELRAEVRSAARGFFALPAEVKQRYAVRIGGRGWLAPGVEETFNINRYPPLIEVGEPAPGQFRIGPHTDFGTVTVLDREPGAGCWSRSTAPAGRMPPTTRPALTVNIGDLLAHWTGLRPSSRPPRRWPAAGRPGRDDQVADHACRGPRSPGTRPPRPRGLPGAAARQARTSRRRSRSRAPSLASEPRGTNRPRSTRCRRRSGLRWPCSGASSCPGRVRTEAPTGPAIERTVGPAEPVTSTLHPVSPAVSPAVSAAVRSRRRLGGWAEVRAVRRIGTPGWLVVDAPDDRSAAIEVVVVVPDFSEHPRPSGCRG